MSLRGLTEALLLVFTVTTASAIGGDENSAGRWNQFRGNPRLTGVASSQLPEELKLLWTYEAGEAVESSAAVVDGVVYVASSYPGELVALNLEDGTVRWKYPVGEEGFGESSPAVGGGVVYIGDLAGVLHAVSADSGEALWTFQTEGEIKSSPVLVEDKVLVGSYDEQLYGLVAKTGELLWKLQTQGYIHGTPAVNEGIAYITGCDAVLRGVQISDGKQVSETDSGAYTGASPAIVDGMAYYGTFNNEVLAIDLNEKKLVWRYEHPTRHFPFYSSAAVIDRKVVLGGRDKMVHCLSAETGEALWTFRTNSRVESSPAVTGGRVYIGSNDGRLYVLDLESGEKLWEFNAGAPLSASPAIASGRLVIGSLDGRVYCFGK
jgi:outer membrane protein assembly factor BamB